MNRHGRNPPLIPPGRGTPEFGSPPSEGLGNDLLLKFALTIQVRLAPGKVCSIFGRQFDTGQMEVLDEV